MNHAINAGMETISCGPETDASKAYMIVSSFHTSFLAAEISISAAEKTRRCGAALRGLQDLSEIQLESGQDGIAAKDRWVFNSCGWLAGTVDHCAFVERIQ